MRLLYPSALIANQGYAALSVDLSLFSLLPIVMRRNGQLYLKKEFHVTIVSVPDQAKPCYPADLVRAAARGIEFSIEPLDELYFISKFYEFERRTRSSVIVRVKVRGIDEFYLSLAALSGKEIAPMPHHITLYTGDEDAAQKGIGIASQDQLDAFGEKLDPRAASPIRSRLLAS